MTDMTAANGEAKVREPSFVDTNVLVYAYDEEDDPAKRRVAAELVGKALKGEVALAISNQILAEFFHVLTTRMRRPIDARRAREVVSDILSGVGFVAFSYGPRTVLRAIDLHLAHRIGHWDGLIAATMLENGLTRIITEDDGGFAKVPGIKAENPFTR